MKNITPILTILLLSGCATPQTVMKNPHTGQVQMCGGNSTSSITGGMIGYHFQLQDDEKCVDTFKNQGFKATTNPKENDND